MVEVQEVLLSRSKFSWSQDKLAVARSVLSCGSMTNFSGFCSDLAVALSQGHPVSSFYWTVIESTTEMVEGSSTTFKAA